MRKFSLVTALVLVLQIPFANAAQAACTSTATLSSSAVTLCISAGNTSITPSSSTKTVTSVRTPSKAVVVVPTCTVSVLSQLSLASALANNCLKATTVIANNATVTKVTTKPATATISLATDSAVFSPSAFQIFSDQSSYTVGQSALLSTNVATQLRDATLLGGPAQVKFVPTNFRWMIDGTNFASQPFAAAAVSSSGLHRVTLEVDFAVSYRLDLVSPFTAVGLIAGVASTSFTANVPAPLPKAVPHLVAATCAEHPSAYRC